MLRLLSSFFFAATLAPAAPYGISIPSGEKPALTQEILALRHFPAWQTLQPSPGKWNMQPADNLIAAAEKSGTQVFGILHPPTAEDSPLLTNNKDTWRTYTATLASRYAETITHWEVLPSYPSTDLTPDAPYHYAQLLTLARQTARESNPSVLIGFSVPDYDLEFLEHSLRDGAEGQFDYISLAPFPVTPGAAPLFLSILPTIREILAEYGMDSEIPIHITLTGSPTDIAHHAQLASENGYARVFLETDPGTFAGILPEEAPIATSPTPPPEEGTYQSTFGKIPTYQGLYHLAPSSLIYDEGEKASRLPVSSRPPITRAAFLAPTFPEGTRELEITVTAKRLHSETLSEHPTGFRITYESIHGIRDHETWWTVPGSNDWQTNTWTITDAQFIGKYAWNFRIDASGAGNDLLIQKVKVKFK